MSFCFFITSSRRCRVRRVSHQAAHLRLELPVCGGVPVKTLSASFQPSSAKAAVPVYDKKTNNQVQKHSQAKNTLIWSRLWTLTKKWCLNIIRPIPTRYMIFERLLVKLVSWKLYLKMVFNFFTESGSLSETDVDTCFIYVDGLVSWQLDNTLL